MEHASKGQIGQPAATMIENKRSSGPADVQMRGDYRRASLFPVTFGCHVCAFLQFLKSRTDSVDNFVVNRSHNMREAALAVRPTRTTEF